MMFKIAARVAALGLVAAATVPTSARAYYPAATAPTSARVYLAPVFVPVASVCVTSVVVCPMRVPIPMGDWCQCITPVGIFDGIAQ